MVYSASSRAPSTTASVAVLAPACPGTSRPMLGLPPAPAARRPTEPVLARCCEPCDAEEASGQPSRTPRTLRAKSSPKPAWVDGDRQDKK